MGGLPVTSISFILPLTFWLQFVLPELIFIVLLHAVLLVVGFLFVLDFPLKKPGLREILAATFITLFTVGIIFMYTRFKLPSPATETSPILEEIMEVTE